MEPENPINGREGYFDKLTHLTSPRAEVHKLILVYKKNSIHFILLFYPPISTYRNIYPNRKIGERHTKTEIILRNSPIPDNMQPCSISSQNIKDNNRKQN